MGEYTTKLFKYFFISASILSFVAMMIVFFPFIFFIVPVFVFLAFSLVVGAILGGVGACIGAIADCICDYKKKATKPDKSCDPLKIFSDELSEMSNEFKNNLTTKMPLNIKPKFKPSIKTL